MSIIQLIQCDGGCKTTLDPHEDLPEGWTVLARGRAHECPDYHQNRKVVEAWESARVRKKTELASKMSRKLETEVSEELAKWDVKNPRPQRVEVTHE